MSFLRERWPAGWRLAWPGDDVGHLYKGCAHKTPWEEGFLLLLYHIAQSSRLARYLTAGRGKRSLFPSCPHLPARKRSKLGMTCPAGRVLQTAAEGTSSRRGEPSPLRLSSDVSQLFGIASAAARKGAHQGD